jgi:hypothetical protein
MDGELPSKDELNKESGFPDTPITAPNETIPGTAK